MTSYSLTNTSMNHACCHYIIIYLMLYRCSRCSICFARSVVAVAVMSYVQMWACSRVCASIVAFSVSLFSRLSIVKRDLINAQADICCFCSYIQSYPFYYGVCIHTYVCLPGQSYWLLLPFSFKRVLVIARLSLICLWLHEQLLLDLQRQEHYRKTKPDQVMKILQNKSLLTGPSSI